MKNYSVVRFGDSINNMITGPSVANFDLLTAEHQAKLLPDTSFITYTEKSKKLEYPGVNVYPVDLRISKEVASRMPLQPHFKSVDKALSILPKLKNKILSVAISGRYSPQAYQFANLVNKTKGKKAFTIVEGHGSDVCGYQLREFENLYKSIYKNADLVILVETPIAKYHFKKDDFPVGNMAVLPTVVNWEQKIDEIKRNPDVINKVRKRYEKVFKIPADARIILTNGRFQPEKGHKYTVLAAKEILKEHPDTYFVIGGSGTGTEREIRKLINKINRKKVKLVGHIPYDDYYALIASSCAYVIPSVELWRNGKLYFAETGPRTVVDGMSTTNVGTTIVIASKSGGTPWKFNMDDWLSKTINPNTYVPKMPKYKRIIANKGVIVENAKNRGLLVDQANPKSIAEAVKIVLDDPNLRKKINRGSKKYVNTWYNRNMLVRKYNRLIESIL